MPDPHAQPPRGRECYAWSKEEDHAFDTFAQFAALLAHNHGLSSGRDYTLTTDAIGNMYFTVF